MYITEERRIQKITRLEWEPLVFIFLQNVTAHPNIPVCRNFCFCSADYADNACDKSSTRSVTSWLWRLSVSHVFHGLTIYTLCFCSSVSSGKKWTTSVQTWMEQKHYLLLTHNQVRCSYHYFAKTFVWKVCFALILKTQLFTTLLPKVFRLRYFYYENLLSPDAIFWKVPKNPSQIGDLQTPRWAPQKNPF